MRTYSMQARGRGRHVEEVPAQGKHKVGTRKMPGVGVCGCEQVPACVGVGRYGRGWLDVSNIYDGFGPFPT
jgi:hypothetical protein